MGVPSVCEWLWGGLGRSMWTRSELSWDISDPQSLQGPGHSVTQHGSDLKGTMEGVVAANYLAIIFVEFFSKGTREGGGTRVSAFFFSSFLMILTCESCTGRGDEIQGPLGVGFAPTAGAMVG